jgi:hypothetical protein
MASIYTGTNIDCFPVDKANATCSWIVRTCFWGIAGWLRSCARQVSKSDLASMAPGAAGLAGRDGADRRGRGAGIVAEAICEVARQWVSTLPQPADPECDSGELSLR